MNFEEDGTYTLVYSSYPAISSFFEDVDFLDECSLDVIVMGLCSYYTLAHGRFDEFEKFHNSYVQKAESLKGLKMFSMPQRRWQ